ncbi:uncharacterized protein CDAR_526721 [Caerostris darwini]|uniref:CCDC113/CCDC96 coiled-coil domain-containing protein n=1 Tax=Caerostris darwini TaxID=1538125 RepID=A0AAV4Q8F6_9ARAC|nr:uncharacterized protein CDAR_526721 [Caerostris darwini]
MDDKTAQLVEEERTTSEKLASLEKELSERESEWNELNTEFTALKQKIAISSVNCDNGERFTAEEVNELLRKEQETREILDDIRLEAIRKRYFLKKIVKEKTNLVEGPLDFGEYEIMCTGTENNLEVVKQLKQETKIYVKKSEEVINILSHLRQKLHSSQSDKATAKEKETQLEDELKEMRNDLFQEKMKYTNMNEKNEELQHKSILLQHPRLLQDHKELQEENETAKKELENLKNTYKAVMKIIWQS